MEMQEAVSSGAPASRSHNVVLSFFETRPVEGLLENHRAYARHFGYRHAVVDSMHIWGERQVFLFRLHAIYHHLMQCASGGLLLVLDQFAVVYAHHPLDHVFVGVDAHVAAQAADDTVATSSMFLLRNTDAIRERLRCLIRRAADWACLLGEQVEAPGLVLIRDFFMPQPTRLCLSSGLYPCIQAQWPGYMYQPQFPHVKPLIGHCAPTWQHRDGRWVADADYDFRGVLCLLEEATLVQQGHAAPHLALLEKEIVRADSELHINPDAQIAFVSIYTDNVASYGRIHEDNFARYCRRHGYGYHLYRAVPDFANGLSGSWAKGHVLRRHLAQHQFLFWVDADVLAIRQDRRVEPLIDGRDAIVATDHTAWDINSSMVGFRNSEAMAGVVQQICDSIESLEDRSGIYASGGDQAWFLEAMRASGLVTQACVVDALTLDASPIYATRDCHFVHFPAQLTAYRAVAMQIWDRWSQSVTPPAMEAKGSPNENPGNE